MALPRNRAHPTVQWKIWYHDPTSPIYTTTWSNDDGLATDAPERGVICIIQTCDGGRSKDLISGADFYAVDEEGKWTGMDESGRQDRIDNNISFTALKEGRWVNTDRYREIVSRAHNDLDFGGLNRPILVQETNEMVDKTVTRVTRVSRG